MSPWMDDARWGHGAVALGRGVRHLSLMLAGVSTGATPIVPELPFIRTPGEGEQRATFFELFFDLVYVFAVTQLSHHLLANLTWSGAAETAFMLVALYWAWNYTTWMTNWFDPDTVPVRLVLVFVMLASLLMAVAIPAGFGDQALLFACAYSGLQIGRNAFVVEVRAGDIPPSHGTVESDQPRDTIPPEITRQEVARVVRGPRVVCSSAVRS
mgnify:CR=1 FL=1